MSDYSTQPPPSTGTAQRVPAAPTTTLPRTGDDLLSGVLLSGALCLAGATLVFARILRRTAR